MFVACCDGEHAFLELCKLGPDGVIMEVGLLTNHDMVEHLAWNNVIVMKNQKERESKAPSQRDSCSPAYPHNTLGLHPCYTKLWCASQYMKQ